MYAVALTLYPSLGKHLKTHLMTTRYQARTECGQMISANYLVDRWDNDRTNVCAICLRRVGK